MDDDEPKEPWESEEALQSIRDYGEALTIWATTRLDQGFVSIEDRVNQRISEYRELRSIYHRRFLQSKLELTMENLLSVIDVQGEMVINLERQLSMTRRMTKDQDEENDSNRIYQDLLLDGIMKMLCENGSLDREAVDALIHRSLDRIYPESVGFDEPDEPID